MKLAHLGNVLRSRTSAPAALTAFLLLTGILARSPIADVTPDGEAVQATLRLPASYTAIAPVSDTFDALTVLSLPQVFATFAFVLVIAGLFRVLDTRRRRGLSAAPILASAHIRFGAVVFGALVAISGLAVLMPRPMAGLKLADRDQVAIDFHSHTSASHDGRPAFTPEANREWHRNAGFDVAYVTDHHSFAGALAAFRRNPPIAGEGTTLLTGLEYRDADEHILALGLNAVATNIDVHEWRPLAAMNSDSAPALLVLCLPAELRAIPTDEQTGAALLDAIELSDGSPQGLEQASIEQAAIISLADSLNLALVTGSDNHGWGRTAAAWSVMRIHGWRAMTPRSLDAAIRNTIASKRRHAVEAIERRRPPGGSVLAIAFTGPELAWGVTRSLSWLERFSWVAWVWGGWALAGVRARRGSILRAKKHWSFPSLAPAGLSERLKAAE